MAAPKLDIDQSPQRHFFDGTEDNLNRKSIFIAGLLKLNF